MIDVCIKCIEIGCFDLGFDLTVTQKLIVGKIRKNHNGKILSRFWNHIVFRYRNAQMPMKCKKKLLENNIYSKT